MTLSTPNNQISNSKSRLALMGLAALALVLLAPTAIAVTERDLATLNVTTTSLGLKTGAPGEIGLGWILGRMAMALGVVFGLMAIVIWAARRYFPQAARAGRGGPIEILTQRALGQRRSLMLVRVQGRMLLLGVTAQSIQALTEFEPETPAASWTEAAKEAGLENGE